MYGAWQEEKEPEHVQTFWPKPVSMENWQDIVDNTKHDSGQWTDHRHIIICT